MKPIDITVDDVVRFAEEFDGETFTTIARGSPFTIRLGNRGIRYELPSGDSWSIKYELIQKYIDCYNASSSTDRQKTTIYPEKLRERSYMARILFEIANKGQTPGRAKNDGLRDLDVPVGNNTPDRALSCSYSVIRDPEVRRYIIKTAEGRCEYCRKEGFLMKNDRRYLEVHHVISLADLGKDTVANVIALCPEHHREAHYGANAESLEKSFMACIKKRNEKQPSPA